MKIRTVQDIIDEISDEYGLPEGIENIFFNSETKEPIGYSFNDEGEPFIYVDMCSDLNEIWKEYPDSCSWDGWEHGIIGHVGSRLVYNVELAEEKYFEENKLNDLSEAIEHWEYNVEGTRQTVPIYCRPYHMYEIFK